MNWITHLKNTLEDVRLEKVRPSLEAIREVIKEHGFTDLAADWAIVTLAHSAVDPEEFEDDLRSYLESSEATREQEAPEKPRPGPRLVKDPE